MRRKFITVVVLQLEFLGGYSDYRTGWKTKGSDFYFRQGYDAFLSNVQKLVPGITRNPIQH
jgi:hypothetical protein